jgi:C4-dicarboxylate-specific signal transduction histidine kinase
VSGVLETVSLADVVDDALRINESALTRHEIQLTRDFQFRPTITLERHKLMQILVNLVRNAKFACDEGGRPDKRIVIRITQHGAGARIEVVDNGVGIPAENLTRIFAHGFTTRKEGHGFGLHSGALVAKELGGSLTARSDGPGLGATFTIDLPLEG